ncbi:TPA: TraP [Yersinia enterocolitica]
MTDLFDDNTPASPTAAEQVQSTNRTAKPAPTQKAKKKNGGYDVKDYAFFGGIAVVAAIGLYFFAFSDDPAPASTGAGTIQTSGAVQGNADRASQAVSSDFQENISSILLKQTERLNEIDNTSKNGMTILSNQLKSANEKIASLNMEVQGLKMGYAANGNRASQQMTIDPDGVNVAQKLLKEFSINDLSNDLAWVKYKNQVYAVKVGTTIGGVTVTSIDMSRRIVSTNKGLIR